MKKVLVITYYWPPSGGGGVQRWLKFTKYLPEFGWEPIVLTPSNPSVLEQDPSLQKEISNSVNIIKIPIWEPYSVASRLFNVQAIPKQGIVSTSKSNKFSMLTWIRGNLLIPDARIFWRKSARKKAMELIEKEGIDLVVTTGPPHSLHLIGLDLKRKCAIKWISDFRDPWSEWDILDQMKLTKITRGAHQKLERKVIESADGTITVSHAWADEFSKKYQKSIKVITNGFEKGDIAPFDKTKPEKFRISHFGLINEYRNVAVLWDALVQMCNENQEFNKDLKLFLAGNIEQSILDGLLKSELADKIEIAGYLPHNALSEAYRKTAVFLLLSNNSKNAKGHIPGKIFEYLYFGRVVLAFCDPDGDVAHIINSSNSGIVLGNNDRGKIKEVIEGLYNNFKRGTISTEQKDVSKYDRRNLGRELAAYFDQITENI